MSKRDPERRHAARYEWFRSRSHSLDALVEWPAELAVIGSTAGRAVLDLGCGSGAKAIELAARGAARVVAVDKVDAFQEVPPTLAVRFIVGDLNELASLDLGAEPFDLVLVLQSIGFVRDEPKFYAAVRERMVPGGTLVVARSHPMRFASEYVERRVPIARAYREVRRAAYAAPWDPDFVLEHTVVGLSAMLNAPIGEGFELLQVGEPGPTPELRRLAPDQAAWMDRHFGIILFAFRAPSTA